MPRSLTRHLLRRIALGLPLLELPLSRVSATHLGVGLSIGLGLAACTRCDTVVRGTSRHLRGPLIEAAVGTPEAFDGTGCAALCRELDSPTRDAGMELDSGAGTGFLSSPGATPRCAYEGSDVLVCTYEDRYCYTQGCIGAIPGRPAAGVKPTGLDARSSAAAWLAENEHLEAASVLAFEDLARDLVRLGAPQPLIDAALRSAADEAHHAAAVGRLARRAGERARPVERRPPMPRSALALALENASAGCVGEAYAALLARHQAEHAASAAVRATYRAIAADEARHALFSMALDAWLQPRLSARGARHVEAHRREAHGALARGAGETLPFAAALGLPDGETASALLALVA